MRTAASLVCLFMIASVAVSQTQASLPLNLNFRHVQVYSFGYSLAPSVQGTDGTSNLHSSGPFTVPGLECPYCTIRPLASQARFVLRPVGQTFVYRPSARLELSHTVAITQPLLPDYLVDRGMITQRGFRISERSKLLGSETGLAFSPDRSRQFWLGGSLRLLQRLNTSGGRGWKTFGGSIGFRPSR